MKALVAAVLLALLVAAPVSAAKRPFIAVDQELASDTFLVRSPV
jgi:hypothetical protein